MGCVYNLSADHPIPKTTKFIEANFSTREENLKISHFITMKLDSGFFKNNYKLEKIIGTGSYGNVFKAYHKITNTVRSVKIVETNKLRPNEIKRIWKEVDILRKLDHPHIIKVYQAYSQKNKFYTVNQFCEGELFNNIVLGSLTQKDISSILKQLLSAVHYCHLNGVIHRNIKPSNILSENTQSPWIIKLADFGLAIKTTQHTPKLTQLLGSVQFCSPEMLQRQYDRKCDIWSCGIILYILLTGNSPFRGTTLEQMIHKIKNINYDQILITNSNASSLLKSMLQKNPKFRFTAQECLNHPFITDNQNLENINLKGALTSLKQFNIINKLQSFAWMYTYHNITTVLEKDRLLREYSLLDTNGDGYLQKDEIINGLVNIDHMDEEYAKAEAQRIFSILDKNKNNAIDYSQFVAATIERSKILTQSNILNIFNMLDINQDGIISKQDLKEIFNSEHNSDRYIQKFMKIDSYDKIKQISFDFFRKMMLELSNKKNIDR